MVTEMVITEKKKLFLKNLFLHQKGKEEKIFFSVKKIFLLLFCYFCSKNGNFFNLKIKNYLEIKIFFIYNKNK
tara:strand:- start:5498 stop:5716 length:219 start_codon:yes stop_codon:yes gene_type:complete